MVRRHRLIPPKVQLAVAVGMFAFGCLGLLLAGFRVIGQGEPFQTYMLSWLAIAYAGFVALEVA